MVEERYIGRFSCDVACGTAHPGAPHLGQYIYVLDLCDEPDAEPTESLLLIDALPNGFDPMRSTVVKAALEHALDCSEFHVEYLSGDVYQAQGDDTLTYDIVFASGRIVYANPGVEVVVSPCGRERVA
jgi:hypothetical protein